ncbi:gamma-glutamyltransferase, partial [Vibrio sp. Vb0877]|uniref:gamma-glutamyltransferase n=1 Tax=Vibrio sp. Vb0877 TaxID=2816073 RepID=UPI001F5D23B6
MGYNSAARYHLLTEAMKRAFADRSEFMADPEYADVPVGKLIDKNYAQALRNSISNDRATPSREIKPGASITTEGNETTHYTV